MCNTLRISFVPQKKIAAHFPRPHPEASSSCASHGCLSKEGRGMCSVRPLDRSKCKKPNPCLSFWGCKTLRPQPDSLETRECPFLSWGFCPAREVSSLPAMDGNEQYLELMCVGPSIPHSHPVRQALTYLHFTDGDDEIGAIKDLTQGHGGRKPHN